MQSEAENLALTGRAREGFLEEKLEPVYWAENHEEVILVIEKRISRGMEAIVNRN